jgi:hypothetical protein
MAIQTTLRCVFENNFGNRVTLSWTNADSTATAAQVKALMETCVENSEIFAQEPTILIGAEFITRNVKTVDIS